MSETQVEVDLGRPGNVTRGEGVLVLASSSQADVRLQSDHVGEVDFSSM